MNLPKIKSYYEVNDDFREYVNKYARTHRMLPEDCLKHIIVKEYLAMLIEEGRA